MCTKFKGVKMYNFVLGKYYVGKCYMLCHVGKSAQNYSRLAYSLRIKCLVTARAFDH